MAPRSTRSYRRWSFTISISDRRMRARRNPAATEPLGVHTSLVCMDQHSSFSIEVGGCNLCSSECLHLPFAIFNSWDFPCLHVLVPGLRVLCMYTRQHRTTRPWEPESRNQVLERSSHHACHSLGRSHPTGECAPVVIPRLRSPWWIMRSACACTIRNK